MTLVDTLTYIQKEQLLEIRNSYLELLKKKEIKALRDRVNDIEEELKPHENSIKPRDF